MISLESSFFAYLFVSLPDLVELATGEAGEFVRQAFRYNFIGMVLFGEVFVSAFDGTVGVAILAAENGVVAVDVINIVRADAGIFVVADIEDARAVIWLDLIGLLIYNKG